MNVVSVVPEFDLTVLLAEDHDLETCPLTHLQINHYCLETLVHQLLLPVAVDEQVEVSIQMLDSTSMRTLNRQYRDKDTTTNVLSFSSDMPVLKDDTAGALRVLGDLVFCPDVVASEAQLQGKQVEQHWAHMIVHGMLHLCGYDHVESDAAALMEKLEIGILSGCGIANPYQLRAV